MLIYFTGYIATFLLCWYLASKENWNISLLEAVFSSFLSWFGFIIYLLAELEEMSTIKKYKWYTYLNNKFQRKG